MIDEVGAVNFNQWMGQEVLVYEFEATVLSRGNLLLQLEPADVLPAHNLLLHGRNDAVTPVEVLFGDLNLRVLSPDDRSGWQNASNFMDVNNDGEITSSDALLVINYLNDRSNDRYLPNTASVAPPFLDTDGNKRVSANDALQIINFLNNRP